MYGNSYSSNYAAPQWTPLDARYQGQFASNKLTQTRNGSQVLETQQPTRPGIGGKLSSLAHRVEERLGGSGNAASRWSLFGLQEPLLAEFPAKTAYGQTSRLGGWIYLAEAHFGWISYTDSQNRVVKTLIPWSNVVNIIPTSRVRSGTTKNYVFSPVNTQGGYADGFQLLTRDNLVYQFFGVKKHINEIFNLFNNVWLGRYTQPGFVSGLHAGGFHTGAYNRGMSGYGNSYGQPAMTTTYSQGPIQSTGLSTGNYSTVGNNYGTTGLAQPVYNNAGFGQTGLVGNQTGLVGNQSGLVGNNYGTTGLAQPAVYSNAGFGQTGLVGNQTGLMGNNYGTTGLAQPAVYSNAGMGQTTTLMGNQTGLAGQTGLIGNQNTLYNNQAGFVKQGLVQPSTTGMVLGQTAPGTKYGL